MLSGLRSPDVLPVRGLTRLAREEAGAVVWGGEVYRPGSAGMSLH